MPDDLRQRIEQAVRQAVERLVPINVSARHMHITTEHLEVLFGPGAKLTKLRDLYQPGEFASNETVSVVGPNRRVFERVRILGPTRSITQVELSYNDGRYIGLELPARISGDIEGTAPIVLVGPRGTLQLPQGVIRALRHVHMNPAEGTRLGVTNGQLVNVKTIGPMSVTFHNVKVRMGDTLRLEMHLDTDEANAAGLTTHTLGLLL